MFKIKFYLLCLPFLPIIAAGQCGNQFSVIDTTCPLKDISVTNNDNSGAQYAWDFCPGDLYQTPVLSSFIIPPGTGNTPEQLRIVKDNGKFYGFIANNGFNYLVRADFGTSLSSQPVYDTLAHNTLINGLTGVDLTKENGKWIGFIVVNSPARIVRAEFDSITDQFPVFTDLGLSGMISPLEIRMIDHFAFVTDLTGALIRYNFNGSYLNTPTIVNPGITLFTLFGVDVTFDCITNSYYAVTGSAGSGGVGIYNFGNDLSSNPVTLPLITYSSVPRGVSLFFENNEWFLATTHANDHFMLSSFGSNLNSTPTLVLDTDFGGGAFTTSFSCQMIKDSSVWHGFAVNVSNSQQLSHFTFPAGNCNVSNPWSAANIPAGINYSAVSSGYYTFQVTVIDTNNEQRNYIDSVYITLLPPVALFTTGPKCENTPVSFFDASDICYGSISNWNWNFGDGNVSNLQNPQHIYAAPGNYTVTLTVYTPTNDSSVYSESIDIVPFPTANFSFTNNVCANTSVQFTDLSVASNDSITAWNWIFGDGDSAIISDPNHIYTNGGIYNIELIAINSNGCSDTITQSIQILSAPVAEFSTTHTCSSEATVFNNETDSAGITSVNYNWDFGDTQGSLQASPLNVYAAAGNYTVTLIATGANSCIDTIIKNVTVTQKAIPDFNISSALACTGSTITFTDNSNSGTDSIIYYHWTFGDTTSADSISIANHNYNNPGSFAVSLTIATPGFCDTTITKNITILQSPQASFSVVNQCLGIPVEFTNTTVPAGGDPVSSYTWLFGDTASSNAFDTIHSYAVAGYYSVTLITVSQAGCVDTVTGSAANYSIPDADFTNYPLLCTDTIASFIDLSNPNNDTLSVWTWDFGDGQTSIDQNPTHIYTTAGSKLVTLTVTSAHGCSDSHSNVISINQSPKPVFTSTPTCNGEATCFTASDTSSSSAPIASWQWNFGDNTLSLLQNPCHTYTASGNNTVTLLVADSNNCKTMVTGTVEVNPVPVSDFTYTNPCTNTSFLLSDASAISTGSITSWLWTINNNAAGNTADISYTATTPGLLPVSFIVNSDKGCSDTIIKYITINQSPVAQFSMSPIISAPGQVVTFTNNSTLANDYLWTFGDGDSDIDSAVTHAYSDTGMYAVTLITVSDNGCSDTLIKNHLVLIPNVDIAILDFTKTINNGLLTLTATVFNSSNVDISYFEIIAEVEGINAIHEFPQLYIPLASSPKTYTFQSSFQLNNEDPGYICIELKNPNGLPDADESNNKICKSNSEQFEILSISPNPVSSTCELNFNMPVKGNADLEIIDATGQQVYAETLTDLKKGYNNKTLNLNSLSQGVYTIVLRMNDEIKTQQLVKTN